MKILYLGPARENVTDFLGSAGELVRTEDPIEAQGAHLDGITFIVCYGYRFILAEKIVRRFASRAINLHVSLLPWNRGADPNLWSFLENTPKGVSIHYIDRGIDTGDILVQKAVEHLPTDTLRTSYLRLQTEIERLFFNFWPNFLAGKVSANRQSHEGTFHRVRDRLAVEHLLTDGWNTPVEKLIGKIQ